MTATIIKSGTTTANTVATVTFATYYPKVEVVNRGSTELWLRTDGVNPTIGGDDCEVIPAASFKDTIINYTVTNTEVRLISSSAVAYTVEGIN